MELTPFVYDKKIKFEFGNALVSCGGKLGYLNSEGKEIIPCIYEDIKSYTSFPMWAKRDGKYGLIGSNYKEITPFIYDSELYFSENEPLCVSSNGKFGYINEAGKTIIPCKYEGIKLFSDGLMKIQ